MSVATSLNHKAARHLQPAEALSADVQLLRALSRDREELALRMEMVQDLVEERDLAMEKMNAMRELTEKSLSELDAAENEVADLKVTLARRDARIGELQERLGQLEKTLAMLAEADSKL